MEFFENENFDGPRALAPKFCIWTSKIMPDLWLADLFCPIKKKFPHSTLLCYSNSNFHLLCSSSNFHFLCSSSNFHLLCSSANFHFLCSSSIFCVVRCFVKIHLMRCTVHTLCTIQYSSLCFHLLCSTSIFNVFAQCTVIV